MARYCVSLLSCPVYRCCRLFRLRVDQAWDRPQSTPSVEEERIDWTVLKHSCLQLSVPRRAVDTWHSGIAYQRDASAYLSVGECWVVTCTSSVVGEVQGANPHGHVGFYPKRRFYLSIGLRNVATAFASVREIITAL